MPTNPNVLTPWKPSGAFSPLVLFAPFLMFLVALPLGALYALVNIHVPIVGVVTAFALGGYAFAVGAVGGFVFGGGRSRWPLLNGALATVGALLSVYALWSTFLFFFLRNVEQDPSFLGVLLSPGVQWALMGDIAEQGWFTVKGSTPSGALLWVFWTVEAIGFVAVAGFAAVSVGDVVWCESCNADMPKTRVLEVREGAGLDGIGRRGSAADLDGAEVLMRDIGVASTERCDAYLCPKCSYSVITVERVARKVGDKGAIDESTTTTLPRHVVPRAFVSRASALAAT